MTAWVNDRPAAIDASRSRSPSGHAACTSRMRTDVGGRSTRGQQRDRDRRARSRRRSIRSARVSTTRTPRRRHPPSGRELAGRRRRHPPAAARCRARSSGRDVVASAVRSGEASSRRCSQRAARKHVPTSQRGEQPHDALLRAARASCATAVRRGSARSTRRSRLAGSAPVHSSGRRGRRARRSARRSGRRRGVGTTAVISVTCRRMRPTLRRAHRRDRRARRGRAPREKTLRTMRSVTFSPAISAALTSALSASRGTVGVDGAQEPATGVDRARELERLGAAHLTDDDPIGPHRQHELHRVAQGDLAGAVESGRPDLVVRAVPIGTASSRISSQQRTQCVAGTAASNAADQRRLARAGLAGDHDPAAQLHDRPQERGRGRRERVARDQLVERRRRARCSAAPSPTGGRRSAGSRR